MRKVSMRSCVRTYLLLSLLGGLLGCGTRSDPRLEAVREALEAKLAGFPYGRLAVESVKLEDSSAFVFTFRVDSLDAHYTANWIRYVDPILWEGRLMRQQPRQGDRFRCSGQVEFAGPRVRALRLGRDFERLTEP